MRMFLVLSFFCFFHTTQAQNPLGFKIGVNLGSFSGVDEDGLGGDLSSILGTQLGISYQIKINERVSIQPEFVFIQKGFKLTGIDEVAGNMFKFKSKFVTNNLDFPVLLRLNFGQAGQTAFFATIGPSFGYTTGAYNVARITANGQTDRQRQDADLKDLAYNRFEVSASFGAGISIPVDPGFLFIETRYLLGLTNLNEEGGSDTANKNRGIGFTFGFMVALEDIEY